MTDIPNRLHIPSLKTENKKKIREIVTKINAALLHIPTTNIMDTNNHNYAWLPKQQQKLYAKKSKRM